MGRNEKLKIHLFIVGKPKSRSVFGLCIVAIDFFAAS